MRGKVEDSFCCSRQVFSSVRQERELLSRSIYVMNA